MKALLALPLLAACIPMMNRQEIEAAQARHVEQLCGAPDYAQQARDSYQNGYAGGIEHAPIVVQGLGGGGGGRARSYSYAETCTFSSDCGEGRSCRADAGGTNVCMGGGYAGDPCWFSSDCVGGSCSDKVCR